METTRPLCLKPCERGEKDSRPILFLRNAPQPSVLVMSVSGFECEVLLHPRFARPLILLVDAWHADVGLPESIRGYRSAKFIALAFRRFTNGRGPIGAAAVTDYVFQLRRQIDRALIAAGIDVVSAPFELIEQRPRRGYRMGPIGIRIRTPALDVLDTGANTD